MTRRVRVFLNAKSGGRGPQPDAQAAQLIEMFAQHDCECLVTPLSRAVNVAAMAKSDPEEIAYIAAGGDGTVNCVANAVAKTRRRMGVLPVGTLNHFAKDLGLPGELQAAVAVAAGDCARFVDAAEVNGQVFVNNSSLGAYAVMLVDRERLQRTGLNRWLSLIMASLRTFVRFRRLRVELDVDGRRTQCRTPFVFVGNNEYCVEGTRLGERERLDGGKLALYLAHGISRAGVLRMIFAAFGGRMEEVPEYEALCGVEATVSVSRVRPHIALDGEVRRMEGPFRYRILPAALCVLSPVGEDR